MDNMVEGVHGCRKNQNFYYPCSSSFHLPEVILRWPSPPPNFLLQTQAVWPCLILPYMAPEMTVTLICILLLDMIQNMSFHQQMNPHP